MVRTESTTPASSNTADLTQAAVTYLRGRLPHPIDRENRRSGLNIAPQVAFALHGIRGPAATAPAGRYSCAAELHHDCKTTSTSLGGLEGT